MHRLGTTDDHEPPPQEVVGDDVLLERVGRERRALNAR